MKSIGGGRTQATSRVHRDDPPPMQPQTPRGRVHEQLNARLLPRVTLPHGEQRDGTVPALHAGSRPGNIHLHRKAAPRGTTSHLKVTFEISKHSPGPSGKAGVVPMPWGTANTTPVSSLSFPMWPHHLLKHPTWVDLRCFFTLIPTFPPQI